MHEAAQLQRWLPHEHGPGDTELESYESLIDKLYVFGMKAFVCDTRYPNNRHYFSDFEWVGEELPMVDTLEYCMILSAKEPAGGDFDIINFGHLAKEHYYSKFQAEQP